MKMLLKIGQLPFVGTETKDMYYGFNSIDFGGYKMNWKSGYMEILKKNVFKKKM